mgnify:CR=1 FL=1
MKITKKIKKLWADTQVRSTFLILVALGVLSVLLIIAYRS